MMKTSTPLAILLPLILLSTAAFSLGAQTPYMDAMYIDVRWDRTDTLGEATMRLEYRMRFPSETGPDSPSETGPDSQANTFELHLTPEGTTVIHKTIMHGPALRTLRRQRLLHRLPPPAQELFTQDVRNFLI